MSYHQSSAALKAAAKEHMFGRYGSAVGAYLLVTFLTGFATISISSIAGGTSTVFGVIIHYALLFAVSYAARYAAKNLVAAGLADRCEIQLAYAIGVASPTSVRVDTFGTGKLEDVKLVEIIRENFDLRPAGIIKMLDLRRPIYKQTAAYGHFGRNDLDLPWEKLDRAETLKKYLADAGK